MNLLLLPVQTLKNNKILLALCTKSDHTIKYDFVHLRMEIITETTGDLFYRIKEKQTASRQDTYGSACHRQSLRQRFFRIYDKRFHVRRKYAVQLAAYADAWDKRCCGLWCVGYHYGAGNRDELKNFFRKSIRIILTMSVVLTIKNVKLCWCCTPKAKGYQIYKYTGKKWKRIKTINKKSTLTYTDKKVKEGKTYKYKIRSYSVVSGKKIYSSFSSVRKVSLKRLTVRGDYKANSVYGPSLNSSQLMQVRRVVQSFKTNYIRKGMSEYDKALAVFLYLRSNCSYARRGLQYNNANNAWRALVYNEAQCSGFARAMKALCDGVGVKCKYVHANSKAVNPSHQWNEIRINGKWYIVDAQSGFFLAGSNTWKNMMGMRWNTKGPPKCSASDHKKFGFYGSIV